MITLEQQERREENEESEQLEDLAEDIGRGKFAKYEGHYDESPEAGEDGLYGLRLADGLTDLEMQFAERLATISRGVMITHGNMGCGKGVFATYVSWKMRRIFSGRRVILDYEARKTFDYGYDRNRFKYFGMDMMMDEVDRMADMADNNISRDPELKPLHGIEKETAEILAQKWADTNGKVLMNDAVWVLDELKRYLHNRKPNNRVGMQISAILTQWRHLGLLCVGMCPNINEIDYNGFLQYTSYEVRPRWCTRWKPHTTKCIIRRKTSVSNDGVVIFDSKPYVLYVNGGRPRPEVGVRLLDGDLALDEPEQKIIEVLKEKNGFANLNEISDMTGEEINECRYRLLKMHGKYPTGNKLLFHPDKPIACSCVFNLYNSRDYKNLNPRMNKTEE
jgi:hypothetical protein